MGVVHKLQPKIRDYLLEKKKLDPKLSCRKLSSLIFDKFQTKLSKSSINALIKASGLSMPVGRRRKRRRIKPEGLGMGAILLRAADYLAGGTYSFVKLIKERLNKPEKDLLAETESLTYLSLFDKPELPLSQNPGLGLLVDKRLSKEELIPYLSLLQGVNELDAQLLGVIWDVLQEVRCVKVSLTNGYDFCWDGQLHTVWPTPYVPYDFSTTIYNIKSYIKKYLQDGAPLILFMAPGYDIPTKEFFDFLLTFDSSNADIKFNKITLCGNKLEELEVIKLEQQKRYSVVFGLWPWQFGQYRKIHHIGEFKPFHYELLNQDFYLAELEMELLQPAINKRVVLRGCALKPGPEEKIKIAILSNFSHLEIPLEDLAKIYLDRWPSLDEAFKDYSRKVELFTYTAASQRFFSVDNLYSEREQVKDIKGLFEYYLKMLDLYVRWHFLPSGYEDKGFPTVNEQFYSLKARVKKQKDCLLVTFEPPSGYAFLKDLQYACFRVNEKGIILADGHRLWCSVV